MAALLRTWAAFALLASTTSACASERDAAAPVRTKASEPASTAAAIASEVHRFTVGALDAIVLFDGADDVPNDGKVFGVDEGPEKVAAVLAGAGQPTDTLMLGVNVPVVRAGPSLFMIDTGNGPMFPDFGTVRREGDGFALVPAG